MPKEDFKGILDRILGSVRPNTPELTALEKVYAATQKKRKSKEEATVSAASTVHEIEAIPPEGIQITEAGTYRLTKSVMWTPSVPLLGPSIAIDILCDEVTLDLGGHEILAAQSNPQADIIGINAAFVNNITVVNGSLLKMSHHAINITGCEHCTIEKIITSEVAYYNVEDPLVVAAGIAVRFSKEIYITACKVFNAKVTAPICAGIELFFVKEGVVRDTQIGALTNEDGIVAGFFYTECQHIQTINCHALDLQSHYLGKTMTAGHTVLGFIPTKCSHMLYESCSAANITGCCDDCHGLSVFMSNHVTILKFLATGVKDGVTPTKTGAKATGLEVYGNDVLVQDSKVENIVAIVPQDRQSAGFSAAGKNIRFEYCIAQGVIVQDAEGNPVKDFEKYGYGVGFGWAPDPRPQFKSRLAEAVIYRGCRAVDCQVGFDTWNHVDSNWEDWSQENCTYNFLQQPGTTRIFKMDKCSELPIWMHSPIKIENHAGGNRLSPEP